MKMQWQVTIDKAKANIRWRSMDRPAVLGAN